MNEYLSREYVISCVDDFLSKTGMPIAAQFFYDCFEECEAADVQPVKHGEWKINSDGYYPYCSVCGTAADQLTKRLTKYCPECGARMDGDSE